MFSILADATQVEFILNIKANNIFLINFISNWILSVCAMIVVQGCLMFIDFVETTYSQSLAFPLNW